MKRAIATIAAAVTLSGGLVACGDSENTASDPGEGAVTEDKGAANATPNEASENVHASDASETEGQGDTAADDEQAEGNEPTSAGAEGETVEQETADGGTALIPADLKTAIDNQESEWGLPETIQQDGDKAVAEFADGNLVGWSQDNGAAPIVGQIAATWKDGGGLNNEIGMPAAPEEELEDGQGWTQSFTNGVLQWVNENGEWGAKTEPRP